MLIHKHKSTSLILDFFSQVHDQARALRQTPYRHVNQQQVVSPTMDVLWGRDAVSSGTVQRCALRLCLLL